jgi:hypothetical protein
LREGLGVGLYILASFTVCCQPRPLPQAEGEK